ncbi:MAG: hypothetical protein HUK14_06020 [Muribaculaceae bacterium]|nr:hypothetical protein [Muribaculaceae bacterium]
MADHKITDFVDQSSIDGLQRLKQEMLSVKEAYVIIANELVKGLKLPVDGIDQLEKLTKQFSDLQQQAADTTKRHSAALSEQERIVANTTNTISRQLMEQERANKTQREAYTEHDRVKKLLDQYHDTYEGQLQSLVKINRELEVNKKAQKDNEKALKDGRTSLARYSARQAELIAQHRALTQEKRTLTQLMTAEEKAAQSQEGSYVQLSQHLELLKKAYKDLSDEGRNSEFGKELENAIQNLDAHLKDTAADMGEFQRNVGNYAIAGRDGVVSTESLTAAMQQQAVTHKDLIDQTKLLEEAKLMLNREDANYQSTLNALNAKIDENKRKLMDVSDILGKEATSAAEAEAQNKRLSEAMKHVDLTSFDAKKRLEEMRSQVERNNQIIAEATGSNEKFADSLLKLIGVNLNFGSSLQGLVGTGNFLDGLKTKVQAFGKTLFGIISNPWALAFLGIAGVAAGFKWWYDFNKGLIEASRLTHNFTGATGDAADKVTADMKTLADEMGKGYDETIGAANTLVQQFGLTWDEAYRKMSDGIVAGADMSGNMLQNIERFAPALRDAGVSADEFMSILAETRNGVFNEEGVQNIVKAGTRLRSMTKQTEEALNAVGISAKQMQADLESGYISMLDAVQQVASKLKEIPENSQEAGQVMKNVFGRTAAEGGTLLIQSIADVNTNIDKAKENMGELGRVNEEQMNAQRKLNETLLAVFKMSDTSFQTMTTQAKTFIVQGITGIIKGCVDIVNWFVELYNKSVALRAIFNNFIVTFKNIWAACKFTISRIIEGFKFLGEIIEGVFTMDVGKIMDGYKKGLNAFKDDFKSLAKEIAKNTKDAANETLNGKMEKVSLKLEGETNLGGSNAADKERNKPDRIGKSPEEKAADKERAKAAKDAEKQAKEELKRIHELEDSKIEIMAEGHEKDLALIRQKFKKKIDEIKGNGETEQDLRVQLAEQCEKEIADCELKYQQELSKINLNNRLASAKKGSKEELDLKLAQLEAERAVEIKEAEKTGADISLINAKFDKQRTEMYEDYAKSKIDKARQSFAVEAAIADNAYNRQLNKLNAAYAEELKAAGSNEAKREEITRRHEEAIARLTEEYAKKKADASISFLEQAVQAEGLSADERIRLEDELAKAKIEYEKAVTDAVIAENERQVNSDKEATNKRIENAQRWLQVASDGLNAFNDLASAIYDAKIEQIEEEQEANTEAGEEEQERITELVNKKVISEEEGEARKRAAAAKTAKKDEELEKKKQELKYKQAVWDKANSVAQAGIATALAIIQAMPNVILAAIAAAMGAVQIATILATPIPKYAKGTIYHPGGPAMVGDGGRSEIVSFGGQMYLTPDKPTLVDMPKGAEVFPDAERLLASNLSFTSSLAAPTKELPSVVVNNDYTDLKREVVALGTLIKNQTRMQQRSAYRAEYEQFKAIRGL